jgi:hypothetical protein
LACVEASHLAEAFVHLINRFPLCSPLGVDVQSQSRGIQNATHQLRQVCNGVFARNKQLMRADPKSGRPHIPVSGKIQTDTAVMYEIL